MENKYYTPDIEDLRIGYECEWVDSRTDWKPFKILCPQDIIDGFNETLRTKYLTKEDIESLGWVIKENLMYGNHFEIKQSNGNTFSLFTKDNNSILISQYIPVKESCIWGLSMKSIIYDGQCKSINELKTIQKLLNI